MGHLIHRQTLELKFANQKDAQLWSSRFSELNRRIILAELERAFDKIDDGRQLRVDRLEIDLGHLPQRDLETDLVKLLRGKIGEALQPYLALSSQLESAADQKPLPDNTVLGESAEAEESMLDVSSLAQLFEQFLQTGQLPWWLQRELAGQLDRLYQSFWQLAPELARQITKQAIAEPVGLQRFIEQFSNRSHRLTLLQLLPPVSGELLVDLRRLANFLLAGEGFGPQSRVISFKLVYSLHVVSKPQQLERTELLMRQFFFTLAHISGISIDQLPKKVDAAVARLKLLPATLAVLSELLRKREIFASRQEFDHRQLETAVSAVAKRDAAATSPAESVDIAVENAGIVLLWPHLNELLGKLDLLATLENGSQRPKLEAVLLLQQLVTGKPAAQENLLVLNKLLCGVPQQVPVPRRCRRNPEWDREVEALLAAVIRQWTALKNTSIGGLRSGFLQRSGILREQGEGWTLQIERKAQDILLEKLPWGIGMIRYSWMPQPLQIEW